VTQVRIPPVLRASADGNKQVDLEGATVGDVLEQLVERFPGLRDQLFSVEGDLNRFVNVYLNSEDVRYLSELQTPAGAGDTIVVLPAMAGGARPVKARVLGQLEPTQELPDTNDRSGRRNVRPLPGPHGPVESVSERGRAPCRGVFLPETPFSAT
jgi:molybdopterin synthase sulfur carrier subunit